MENNNLKKIISKIREYDLSSCFKKTSDFDKWLKELTPRGIKNFLSLDIPKEKIKFLKIKSILINKDLLNKNDYLKKLNLIVNLKDNNCLELYDYLVTDNFLNSKNYYLDMELLSNYDNIRFALMVISNDNFINSKYHDEDLRLILESSMGDDTSIPEALVMVAKNRNSINSIYHREDMRLIANASSDYLEAEYSSPEWGLNYLAINKNSLQDKYHLANMKIYLNNKTIDKNFLYNLMTTPKVIEGKYYRDEIAMLLDAKSYVKAFAIYLYILNLQDSSLIRPILFDYLDIYIQYANPDLMHRENNIEGSKTPDYLERLKLLNQIDDNKVLYIEHLLSDKEFAISPYVNFDIDFLLKIKDKKLFEELFIFVKKLGTIESKYHEKDLKLISQVENSKTRSLLKKIALNENNLHSKNHLIDMELISKLDLETFNRDYYKLLYKELMLKENLDSPYHIENLKHILNGEEVIKVNTIDTYLDELESNIENNNEKVLSKIKKLFKK